MIACVTSPGRSRCTKCPASGPRVINQAVTAVDMVDGESRAECGVWLERDGERVVTGTAVVAFGNDPEVT